MTERAERTEMMERWTCVVRHLTGSATSVSHGVSFILSVFSGLSVFSVFSALSVFSVFSALSVFSVLSAFSALSAQSPDPLAGRSKGSPTAPVTVYEMSDFQCPYCRRFALETFPELERAYIATGKVRWVFVNFPLTSVHPNAVAAAETALCASKQGAFWAVHDLLYQHQDTWAPLKEPGPFLLSLADSATISKPALLACVQAPATRNEIRADAEGAERSGASSTPSFYIEGGLLVGAQPLPVFRQVLDSIYQVKRTGGGEAVGR